MSSRVAHDPPSRIAHFDEVRKYRRATSRASAGRNMSFYFFPDETARSSASSRSTNLGE